MIDLHMHSVYSDDGEFSPSELVRQCKAAGVTVMSITDHNSARGNKEAREAAEKCQIHYISGIEIDCTFDGINFHLLGYGIKDENPDFWELEKNIIAQEKIASYKRLKLTNQLGFRLTEQELNEASNIEERANTWTGEGFAEVLLADPRYKEDELLLPYREGGARSDNPYVNFYWDYYAQGRPCYVKVEFPNLEKAIAMIKNNGGKAVLAHPGNNLKGRLEWFEKIVSSGIDGVEVFCSYHDKDAADYFYEQAVKHNLIVTCGSDYHGKIKPAVKLGTEDERVDGTEDWRVNAWKIAEWWVKRKTE